MEGDSLESTPSLSSLGLAPPPPLPPLPSLPPTPHPLPSSSIYPSISTAVLPSTLPSLPASTPTSATASAAASVSSLSLSSSSLSLAVTTSNSSDHAPAPRGRSSARPPSTRRRTKLSSEERAKILEVRRQRACLRCKMLKIQVSVKLAPNWPQRQGGGGGKVISYHAKTPSAQKKTRASRASPQQSGATSAKCYRFVTVCALGSLMLIFFTGVSSPWFTYISLVVSKNIKKRAMISILYISNIPLT